MFRAILAFSAIAAAVAQDNDTMNATERWAADKEDKMAAVNKVIKMLQDLQTQVNMEGEEEAHMYNEFACFCKDTMKEKNEAIKSGNDAKDTLTTDIEKLMSRREELDGEIKDLEKDIKKTKKKMDEAQEDRDKELKQYEYDSADLKAALEALEGALQELKSAKTYVNSEYEGDFKGFLQTHRQAIGDKVQAALLLAEALGLAPEATKRATAFFQRDAPPEIPTEAYSFKSGTIIETLEDLQKKFSDEKTKVDKAEVDAVAKHDLFMQDQDNIVKTKTKEMEDAQSEKAEKQAEVATKSAELTTVAAVLLDDQEYLKELGKMCHEKAVTWDQRSDMRSDELQAITACLQILEGVVSEKTSGATVRFNQFSVSVQRAQAVARDEGSMEAIEAAAEAPSFLSVVSRHQGPDSQERARQAALNVLKSSSAHLKSTTLATLVSQLSDDPFAKVKTLIEELIERLLKEAANEATQKGWCDKSMSAATQKRDYAAEKIAELNGNMAELEATRDKLAEELEVLTEEIKELKKARKEAEAMRKQEAKEHEIIISEAKVGKEAMEEAIKIIDRYYKKARKSEVKLSLAQQSPSFDLAESAGSEGSYNPETINTAKPTESPVTPGDQAPDSGFESGEAYTGAKGVEGGILGMLEVIESDFARTITETEKAEQQAQQEHLEFMTETGKSLAEKEVAESEKTKQKDDAESKLQDDKDSLVEETDILKTSVEELIQLHGACVDTGMTWEERIAAREDEIEALKKALCILEAYEKYGPKGIGDDGSC